MSNTLHFWNAFAEAQENFERALEDEKALLEKMEQDAEREQQEGIGRHFLAVGGYIRKAVDEVIPNANRN